jgi:hypothetical protein
MSIEVKNAGTQELTFIKCEYSIYDENRGTTQYTGKIEMVDKLEPGKSVRRQSEEIKESLVDDNDGRNFHVTVKCYSAETGAQDRAFLVDKKFT